MKFRSVLCFTFGKQGCFFLQKGKRRIGFHKWHSKSFLNFIRKNYFPFKLENNMKTDKRYFRYEKCLQILLNTKINKGEITWENTDFLITYVKMKILWQNSKYNV